MPVGRRVRLTPALRSGLQRSRHNVGRQPGACNGGLYCARGGAMTRRLPMFGLAVGLSCAALAAQAPAPSITRTVYITVADKTGVPVDDLTAEDFEIKEGGKNVEVTQAAVAKDPMQIALIVDDNGTGIFRSGLARFVQRMEGHAVMALSSVTGQTMKLVDYTP